MESKSLSFDVNVVRVISTDLRQSRLVFFLLDLSEVTYVSDHGNLRYTLVDVSVANLLTVDVNRLKSAIFKKLNKQAATHSNSG